MQVKRNAYTHLDRLQNASQYARVFDQAIKSSSEFFTILSRENAVGQPRLGIVVAKRHAKRAIDRNTIKRIIRESFRQTKSSLPTQDYIVILKRPIKSIKKTKFKRTLKLQVETLWEQV